MGHRGSIDIFALLASLIIGLIAVVFLLKFVGVTGSGLDYKVASETLADIKITLEKICRSQGKDVITVKVPNNYIIILRDCSIWYCENCEDEQLSDGKMLDGKLKKKIFSKFCHEKTDKIAVTCFLRYKQDTGIISRITGKSGYRIEESRCMRNYCGIGYRANLILPGREKYTVVIAGDGDEITLSKKS